MNSPTTGLGQFYYCYYLTLGLLCIAQREFGFIFARFEKLASF